LFGAHPTIAAGGSRSYVCAQPDTTQLRECRFSALTAPAALKAFSSPDRDHRSRDNVPPAAIFDAKGADLVKYTTIRCEDVSAQRLGEPATRRIFELSRWDDDITIDVSRGRFERASIDADNSSAVFAHVREISKIAIKTMRNGGWIASDSRRWGTKG
jgi:hypothetical protein